MQISTRFVLIRASVLYVARLAVARIFRGNLRPGSIYNLDEASRNFAAIVPASEISLFGALAA